MKYIYVSANICALGIYVPIYVCDAGFLVLLSVWFFYIKFCFFCEYMYILYDALLMFNNRWNLWNFMIFSSFYLIYPSVFAFASFTAIVAVIFSKVKVWKEIFLNLFTYFFFFILCVCKLNLHTIGMSWIYFYSFVHFSYSKFTRKKKKKYTSTWNIMKCPSCVALFLNLCT